MVPCASRCAPPLLALVLLGGCGGAARTQSSSALSLDDIPWEDPPPSRANLEAPITLRDGIQFQALVASTRFSEPTTWVGPANELPSGSEDRPHCSVYVLRQGADGLEEARAGGPCGAQHIEEARLSFHPVTVQRARMLRAALAGAVVEAAPDLTDRNGEAAGTRVRLETSREVIDGLVADPAWPPPDQPDQAKGRAPRGLSEVWEAVMFPQRYGEAGEPPRSATAGGAGAVLAEAPAGR